MDSQEVAEIKKYVGGVAEGLQGEIREVKRGLQGDIREVKQHIGVVAEGLRGEIQGAKRHAGVVAEGLGSQIRQLAEAVSAGDTKIDREVGALREETRTEFAETKALIRLSYAELDRRLRTLEGR